MAFFAWRCFALRGDLLLPVAAKVGKNAICAPKEVPLVENPEGFKTSERAIRGTNMLVFTTRSRRIIFFDSSKDRLCFCAAAADAVQRRCFCVYRAAGCGHPALRKVLLYPFVGRHDHMPPRTTIRLLPLHRISGSGARGTGDTSYDTIITISRERVVKGRKFVVRAACRKS